MIDFTERDPWPPLAALGQERPRLRRAAWCHGNRIRKSSRQSQSGACSRLGYSLICHMQDPQVFGEWRHRLCSQGIHATDHRWPVHRLGQIAVGRQSPVGAWVVQFEHLPETQVRELSVLGMDAPGLFWPVIDRGACGRLLVRAGRDGNLHVATASYRSRGET